MLDSMKAALIGIDGHTFDLLEPWIKKYDLPNLEKLFNEGIHGRLESTIPPSTAAAFPALYTGVTSQNSGLYGWRELDLKNNQQVRINTNRFKAQRLWNILSDNNLKSVWLNVPTTYPPDDFDGWMITGLTTPDTNSNFTHPPELKEEILDIEPDYKIHPNFYYSDKRSDEFFDEISSIVQKRYNVAKYLWKNKDWDFFVTHFRFPDCILHHVWPENDEIEKKILKIQKELDDYLGWFLNHKDVNFLFFSDHGFTRNEHHINTNRFLIDNDLLSLKENKSSQVKNRFLAWLKQKGKEIARKYDLMHIVKKILSQDTIDKLPESSGYSIPEDVDWSRSKAVAIGAAKVAIIYLNPDIEEKKPQIDQLKGLFNNLAEQNDIDIEFITPKKGPDLLIVSREKKWDFSHDLSAKSIITHNKNNQHDHEGIFFAKGPDFNSGHIENMRIWDIPSIVLHMFDIPIPSNMEGNINKDIFREGSDPKKRDIKSLKAEESAISKAIGDLSKNKKI